MNTFLFDRKYRTLLLLVILLFVIFCNLSPIIKEPIRITRNGCPLNYSLCVEEVIPGRGMGFYSVLRRQFKGWDIFLPGREYVSLDHLRVLAGLIPRFDDSYDLTLTESELLALKEHDFIKITYMPKTYIPKIYKLNVVGRPKTAFIWDSRTNEETHLEGKKCFLLSYENQIYIVPLAILKKVRGAPNVE